MNIPSWYETILLSLAAWRMFHLIAEDDILDRPRRYVTRLGDWEDNSQGTKPTPKEYRLRLAEFLTCPYCFGAWVALAWWGAWLVWPHGTLVVAVPWALSAGLIATAKVLSES